MSTFAAVMTGKGTGAIATIQLFGPKSKTILKKIFTPARDKSPTLEAGKIHLGRITDGEETIDQVTIGCESGNSFAINCHGNPLIVEMLMQLVKKHGAKLIAAEQLLAKILSEQKSLNTIAIEAKLTQPKAKTLEGTKIIANQIESGLTKTAQQWLDKIESIPLEEIKAGAAEILERSQIARLLIAGCKIAIAGPPNSGKSTLLNCLCGTQKAIVTDIKGTTRDWVSAQCRIGRLSAELIDTAGLGEILMATAVDKAAQQKSTEILQAADLILFVLDNNQSADQFDDKLLDKFSVRKILTVLNKSDLPAKLDAKKLPSVLSDTVLISAKFQTNIDTLINKIQDLIANRQLDLHTPVCFTSRQEELLEKLKNARSKSSAGAVISKLLNGQIFRHCEEAAKRPTRQSQSQNTL
ncbi:MAG: 50S ribosome-binding GTPase [Planctomycetota bacterium]|nr:MAG: 50S ribosome-binding GTPase [Planctomycetota bacterium]